MQSTRYAQDVKRQRWVADAAARAERRSGSVRSHPTPLAQVQQLVASIMDQRISRAQLREIASAISEGRA